MLIRRLPILVLVTLASFGLVSIVLAAAGQAHEPVGHILAKSLDSPATRTIQSVPSPRNRTSAAPLATLQIQVNYGHDWVAGQTDPFVPVAITITHNAGGLKAEAILEADETGDFFTNCDSWSSGACPDIQPGDTLTATTIGASAAINPIGSIFGTPNPVNDQVTGTLSAPWLPNPTTVYCQVWEDPGSDQIETAVNPNSGQFMCDFVSVGWDLQIGDLVAVSYFEDDGDQVINMIEWPFLAANIGPWSDGNRHVWGSYASPNASVVLTVTTDSGVIVASTASTTDLEGNFDTGDDLPEGTLGVNNIIYADFDGISKDTLTIYPMSGAADPGTDFITVTSTAVPPTYTIDLEVCAPEGTCNWANLGEIGDSGEISSNLMSDHGIDVAHGASLHAHMNVRHGHQLIYSWGLAAPELGLEKWHTEGYARPGGVVVYGIYYSNDGSGPAENVLITETLPANTTYANDTSGYPVTVGPDGGIIWELGTLDPGEGETFFVTLNVDPGILIGAGAINQNCAMIASSSHGDWDPGNDSSCTPEVDVWEDEVDLSVTKWVEPSDPHPGQEFDYGIEWCNQRGAAAGPVTMTDTLPVGVSLLSWQESESWMHFWSEVSASDEQLVLYAPGLPGDRCGTISMRALLEGDVSIPTKLVNLVDLDASGDINPDNDWWVDESAFASPTRYDMTIEKDLGKAVLVPCGYIDFWLGYRNQGNVESTVHITDTLPAGLSYQSGFWGEDTPWAGESLPDPTIIGNQLAWDLPPLGVNDQHSFNIRLAIDGGANPNPDMENCAAIASEGPDATLEDNSACVHFPINPPGPNLQVEKWSEWYGEGQLGYTIRFVNTGDQAVSDVWITDTLPVGVQASNEPTVDYDGQDPTYLISDTVYGSWLFNFSEILPGEAGFIYFDVDLLEPGTPLRWYFNIVEISLPLGDTTPGDNFYEDTAFSGGEVKRVEMWLNPNVVSHLWGEAVSGAPVTVTTPSASYFTIAEPDCGGCWVVDNAEPLEAGDIITVSAGAGLQPVAITIPDPFDAEASSITDQVWGQIDHLDSEWIEVDMYGGPTISSQTDGNGFFDVAFIDVPRGGEGEVLYETEVDYTEVVFHRYWRSADLTLNINYGHDWVEGLYELGHTVWITVTESDGNTVKGTAELSTEFIPDWDRTGFSTDWGGWSSDRPDIVPGDWVLAQMDNGYTSTVQVGMVGIVVDYSADTSTGTIDVPGYLKPPTSSELLEGSCEIWGVDNGPGLPFLVDPALGQYNCDFNLLGWNIDAGQTVAVSYIEPAGHKVINTQDWLQMLAHSGPASGGERHVWGHMAPPNSTITLTVQAETGAMVANTVLPTDGLGNFDSGENFITGTITAGNLLVADFGRGITDTLTIYPVAGEADVETDVITITVDAPQEVTMNLVFCDDESELCDERELGQIGESGSLVIDLMDLAEFNVTENSSFHPHFTVEHNHILIYSWTIPADDTRRIYLPVTLKNST